MGLYVKVIIGYGIIIDINELRDIKKILEQFINDEGYNDYCGCELEDALKEKYNFGDKIHFKKLSQDYNDDDNDLIFIGMYIKKIFDDKSGFGIVKAMSLNLDEINNFVNINKNYVDEVLEEIVMCNNITPSIHVITDVE
jgi:hypothetical protein